MFLTVTPPWLTGLSDSSLSSGPGAADGEGSGAVHRRFWSGPQEVLERSTGASGAVQRMSTIDYSAWDHIYVSDDEDVTSPFVDTSSLFRMRHRARLERTADVQQRREDLEKNCAQCRQRLEDAQLRLRELGQERKEGSPEDKDTEAELRTVQAEVRKLEKDEKVFEKLMTEHRREEKKIPWNVDTISKEGFSRSVFNIEAETAEEEEDAEKRRTFLETHGKEIKHFGMLRRWDDSQKYLSDNPQLVCEETAHGLVSTCIDLEIDQEAKYHLKRCIDSGLWVPDTGEGDEEDEEDEEEDDDEDGGDKNNDTD